MSISEAINQLFSNPKNTSPLIYRNLFKDYLLTRKISNIIEVLNYTTDKNSSLYIDAQDLINYDSLLSYKLFQHPLLLLPLFEESLLECQSLINIKLKNNNNNKKSTIKYNCVIRIINLPPIPDYNKSTITDIKSEDNEKLLQLSGTIVRTGIQRMLEVKKRYKCNNNKCQFQFEIKADNEQDYMLSQPRVCPSLVNNGYKCNSTNIKEIEDSSVCIDIQEIKLQDHIERLSFGSIPRSIMIILDRDLVDKFNAGDSVIIVGTLLRQWKPIFKGKRCQINLVLQANSIINKKITDSICSRIQDKTYIFTTFWSKYKECYHHARNLIVKSICPQLYGLYFVKLSLLLTLIGGSINIDNEGIRIRSQSHLLLVGDPGCGKSQILRFAAKVSSRSVLTTGIGTSSAGLTCSAVKDGNSWSVEAGALVLANEGVCCIDEFASIKENDRATIHEAMEQQTISLAKAGLLITLNTRSTVIACCNPKGHFDVTADLTTNTAIATPLLSRFDLILDCPNKNWDKKISTFLLQEAIKQDYNVENIDNNDVSNNNNNNIDLNKDFRIIDNEIDPSKIKSSKTLDTDLWNIDTIKEYINYVKVTFQPKLTPLANITILRYYNMQRQQEDRSAGRSTIRLLQSLTRLSQSHAKLMFRQSVLFEDAVVAIHLMSLSDGQKSIGDTNGTLHSDFPVDSEFSYLEIETYVLKMLHITKENLCKEINNNNNNNNNNRSNNQSLNNQQCISQNISKIQQSITTTSNSDNNNLSNNQSQQERSIDRSSRSSSNIFYSDHLQSKDLQRKDLQGFNKRHFDEINNNNNNNSNNKDEDDTKDEDDDINIWL